MKSLIKILFLSLLLFTSCDKQKQSSRKLEGTWDIKIYKRTYPDGISLYPTCSGTLTIGELESEEWDNTYSLDIKYTLSGNEILEKKSGNLNIIGKGDYMDVTILDDNGPVNYIENHRIMVLTSTDLQIVYMDSLDNLNSLTFKRKD